VNSKDFVEASYFSGVAFKHYFFKVFVCKLVFWLVVMILVSEHK